MANQLVNYGVSIFDSTLLTTASLVRHIERLPTSSGDVPVESVTITKSGVLDPTDPYLTQNAVPTDGDRYEDYPEDDDSDVQNPEIALSIAKEIRELGNKLFKDGNAREALNKYQSAYIYLER